jgi:hypothetical protein
LLLSTHLKRAVLAGEARVPYMEQKTMSRMIEKNKKKIYLFNSKQKTE